MKIQPKQFARAYMEVCEGKTEKEVKEITNYFLKLLRKSRAWKKIPAIMAHIESFGNAKEQKISLTLTTAHAVSGSVSEKIMKKLDFKKTKIREEINPRILGGFIVRTKDMLYDSSIKTHLEQLKKHLQS